MCGALSLPSSLARGCQVGQRSETLILARVQSSHTIGLLTGLSFVPLLVSTLDTAHHHPAARHTCHVEHEASKHTDLIILINTHRATAGELLNTFLGKHERDKNNISKIHVISCTKKE